MEKKSKRQAAAAARLKKKKKEKKAHGEPQRREIVALRLIDGTVKKMIVNEFTTGEEFREMAASKVELIEHEHFRIANRTSEDDTEETWLDDDAYVLDQGVSKDTVPTLKVKYFRRNFLEITDPFAIFLFFMDVKARVMSGAWPVSEKQAVRLASYVVQSEFGDYDADIHKPGFMKGESSLEHFLPAQHIPADKKGRVAMERRVFEDHAKRQGEEAAIAQINYLEYCCVLETYGATFFTCSSISGAGAGVDASGACELGVTPAGVRVYTAGDASRTQKAFFPYNEAVEDCLVEGTRVTAKGMGVEGGDLVMSVADERVARRLENLLEGYQLFDAVGQPKASKRLTDVKAEEGGEEEKQRVKVHTADRSYKVFLISPRTTVKELMEMFAEKIELKDRRYFGLAESTSATDRWLDPRFPVLDQFVTADSNLYFKLRYFFVDQESLSTIKDNVAKQLYYLQFKQYVLDGYYIITPEKAPAYAAKTCLIEYGIYDETVHRSGFLINFGLEKFIPSYMIDAKSDSKWEKEVFREYKKYGDMGSEEQVMMEYVAMCSQISTFGITYFEVQRDKADGSGVEDVMLGVAHQGLVILEKQHFSVLSVFLYKRMRFTRTPTTLKLYVREKDKAAGGEIVWNEYEFDTLSPLQGMSIVELAGVYQQIAYQKAKARAAKNKK
jgi:hypothetical protein